MLTRLARRLGYRDTHWGDWTGLDTPDQLPRYRVIADWHQTYAPTASVLDLGCGQGLVRRYLSPAIPYTGIDLQPAAIAEAQRAFPEDRFFCADIRHRACPDRFGLILFNEVLYYQPSVASALALIQSYRDALTDDGLVLTSIWIDPAHPDRLNTRVLTALDTYQPLERAVVAGTNGAWHLALYRL